MLDRPEIETFPPGSRRRRWLERFSIDLNRGSSECLAVIEFTSVGVVNGGLSGAGFGSMSRGLVEPESMELRSEDNTPEGESEDDSEERTDVFHRLDVSVVNGDKPSTPASSAVEEHDFERLVDIDPRSLD